MSNGKGSKDRYGICGYKKRGSNHHEGSHHKAAMNGKKRPTVRDRNNQKNR